MRWQYPVRSAFVVGSVLLAMSACGEPPVEFGVVNGDCQDVFGGEVCAWAVRTEAGITTLGATVPMAMVEGAPMEGPMVFPPVADAVLMLPADVQAATGFNHLQVGWELHGHPPATFMTPHFDFHFYTMTPEEVAAIDCSDTTKPEAGPDGYALPDITIPDMGTLVGLCVPQMGMHAMAAHEMQVNAPFGASMIVGYYGGALNFLEPMISRTKLMEAATFEIPVPPAPPGKPVTVRWPRSFQAEWDAATRSYRFAFELD